MSLNVAPIQQRRLRRFVDRDAEMRVFRAMLDQTPTDQPVTVVWATEELESQACWTAWRKNARCGEWRKRK